MRSLRSAICVLATATFLSLPAQTSAQTSPTIEATLTAAPASFAAGSSTVLTAFFNVFNPPPEPCTCSALHITLTTFSLTLFSGDGQSFDVSGDGATTNQASHEFFYTNAGDYLASVQGTAWYDLDGTVIEWGELWPGSGAWVPIPVDFHDSRTLDVSVSTPIHVTTPIPEPESYALLLAGLGLLGFEARRRRKLQRSV